MKPAAQLTPMTLIRFRTFVVTLAISLTMRGTVSGSWQVSVESGGAFYNQSGGTFDVGGVAGTDPGQLAVQYSQPLADVGTFSIDYSWLSSTDYKARVGIGLYDASGNIALPGQILESSAGEHIESIISNVSGGSGLSLGPGASLDGGGPGGAYQVAPYYFNGPTSGALMLQRNGDVFQGSYFASGTWHPLFTDTYSFGSDPVYPWIFTSNSNNLPSWEATLSNFSADVVPEPSSLVLAMFGLSGLAAWGYRRRFNQN